MKATKVKDVLIYRDEDYYCGPGPAAVAFPDGELAVFFRRHRSWTPAPFFAHMHPATEQCIVRSADGGETWGDNPRVFHGGGQCACATRLRDGTLLFVTHRQEMVPDDRFEMLPGKSPTGYMEPYLRQVRAQGLDEQADRQERTLSHWARIPAGTEVWRSDDRGLSWDGPAWVKDIPDLPPLVEGLHPPVQIRGFPVELRDGTVVLPVQDLIVGSILAASTDRGRSWTYRGVAARSPDGRPWAFDEWSVHETPSRDLVGFIRSESSPEEGGGFLWTARSSDGGVSWGEPVRHDVWGFPYFVQPLPSGHALMVYGYRRPPYGIRCRVLDPECERPAEAEEVVLRDDGGMRDLGYPHATLMPDGRVLVVYYFNDAEDGQRHIAGSIVEVA